MWCVCLLLTNYNDNKVLFYKHQLHWTAPLLEQLHTTLGDVHSIHMKYGDTGMGSK